MCASITVPGPRYRIHSHQKHENIVGRIERGDTDVSVCRNLPFPRKKFKLGQHSRFFCCVLNCSAESSRGSETGIDLDSTHPAFVVAVLDPRRGEEAHCSQYLRPV